MRVLDDATQAASPARITVREDVPHRRLGELCDRWTFEHVAQGDGVLVGTGRILGRPVVVFAQDGGFRGGSMGIQQADLIVAALDRARRDRLPVVGVLESGGARVQQGIGALAGYSRIFQRQVALRGVVPQISVVLGACAGGGCYAPALTDLTVMATGSHMFLTGPRVVRQAVGEDVSADDLGGIGVHARNGVAHLVAADEHHALRAARALLGLVGADSRTTSAGPAVPLGERPLPERERQAYDVRTIVDGLVDDGSLLELAADWAPNVVCGLARLGGRAVAIVANQPSRMGGALDGPASQKAADLIGRADDLGLPVITLVDTPGFIPGSVPERDGIIRLGATIVRAYAAARVPRITLVLRKAYGGGYIAMGSRQLGTDLAFAWPGARIGVMGGAQAAVVVHRRAIDAAADPAAEQARLAQEYDEQQCSAQAAVDCGSIDEIVDPQHTRTRLIGALGLLERRDAREAAHANDHHR